MADRVKLINKNDLANGEMKEISANGRHYLVAMVAGQIYVADGRCPHLGGKLAEGKLDGTVVTCPLHGSQFDLKDGNVVRWTEWTGLISRIGKAFKSPRPLKVYMPEVEGDTVSISI